MVVLVNRAKMTTSTTGTGTITLGSVVDGYQTFAAAGVSNGDSVRYVIEDGTSNWEIGSGTYTASGTTLSRNPSESSDGGSAITLSGDAIVFISAIASDIQPITYVTTTFTATAAQTTFTVSYTAGLVEVFLNGAKLSGADFTATNGTSIVLASGANVGDTVDVIAYGTVSVANTYTQAQADALFVDVAGDTMTGNLAFGDNDKAIFGAGSDLQIYSDGTTGQITGDVNITGTLTSDGLTSSAVITAEEGRSNTAGTGQIVIDPDDTTISAALRIDITDNKLNIDMNGGGTWKKGFSLYSNNDISFYEDTGTTAKFFWDASAERLAVGGTTTNATLHVHGNSVISNGNFFSIQSSSGLSPELDEASNGWAFTTNGSEAMRIDSSGNVGIGTSSPSANLEIVNTATEIPSISLSSTGTDHLGLITGTVSSMMAATTGNNIIFAHQPYSDRGTFSNLSEAMRIDSSGNVGIGSSAPGMLLEVDASSGSANDIARFSGRNSGGLTFRNATANEFILHTATSDALIFGTNGNNERMRIDSSGDVNIVNELKAGSYNETYAALSGTTPAVNCETGNVFALSTTGNTTFTFTNPPTSGTGYGFILKLTAGGTHTVSWPASVDWAAATAPDAPASGETDVLGFLTYDGGTTWYGFLAGDAMG